MCLFTILTGRFLFRQCMTGYQLTFCWPAWPTNTIIGPVLIRWFMIISSIHKWQYHHGFIITDNELIIILLYIILINNWCYTVYWSSSCYKNRCSVPVYNTDYKTTFCLRIWSLKINPLEFRNFRYLIKGLYIIYTWTWLNEVTLLVCIIKIIKNINFVKISNYIHTWQN